MHWYKFAKIQKEALNKNDLYDFYLISRISEERFKYLFKTDPEKRYYFAKKLDEIKSEYIIGGMFAINLELSHSIQEELLAIDYPEEIPMAIKYFMEQDLWPGFDFAGKNWAKIAELIYGLFQFPSLMDLITEGISDEFLIKNIYSLIFKIDHINDICHNTGIALPKMMNEDYSREIPMHSNKMPDLYKEYDESKDWYVSSLESNTEYSKTKRQLNRELKDFLDYKRDGEILHLLGHREGVDRELLESLRGLKGSEKIDVYNAIRILKKWSGNRVNYSLNDLKKMFFTLFSNINNPIVSNELYYLLKNAPQDKLKNVLDILAKEDLQSFFSENFSSIFTFFINGFMREPFAANFIESLFSQYAKNQMESEITFRVFKSIVCNAYDIKTFHNSNNIKFEKIWKKLLSKAFLDFDSYDILKLLEDLSIKNKIFTVLAIEMGKEEPEKLFSIFLNKIINRRFFIERKGDLDLLSEILSDAEKNGFNISQYIKTIHSFISFWQINDLQDILGILGAITVLGHNINYNEIKDKINEIISFLVDEVFKQVDRGKDIKPHEYLLDHTILNLIRRISVYSNLDLLSLLLKAIEKEEELRATGGQTTFDFNE